MGEASDGYVLTMLAFAVILVGAAILRLRDAGRLKTCPHCREKVAKSATRCPHCQSAIG